MGMMKSPLLGGPIDLEVAQDCYLFQLCHTIKVKIRKECIQKAI